MGGRVVSAVTQNLYFAQGNLEEIARGKEKGSLYQPDSATNKIALKNALKEFGRRLQKKGAGAGAL